MKVRVSWAALPFVLIAIFAGSYILRWMAVVLAALILSVALFGFEIKLRYLPRTRFIPRERKSEFERTVMLISRARSGAVARALIEEKIIDSYAVLADDYNREVSGLKSEPNAALRALHSDGDFLDNLEKALEILEADLNES
ncbi:hypothetical protein [Thermococcus sp.]